MDPTSRHSPPPLFYAFIVGFNFQDAVTQSTSVISRRVFAVEVREIDRDKNHYRVMFDTFILICDLFCKRVLL